MDNIHEGNPRYFREDVYRGNKSEDNFLCVSYDEVRLNCTNKDK